MVKITIVLTEIEHERIRRVMERFQLNKSQAIRQLINKGWEAKL
jgi:hypothetical protein